MKNNSPHRISTEITTEKIKIMNDIDLNALFNLNYNFDLLKGIIEQLLKNQNALQNQIDDLYGLGSDKDKRIELLEKEIKYLKETYVNKNDIKSLEDEDYEIGKSWIEKTIFNETVKKYIEKYSPINTSMVLPESETKLKSDESGLLTSLDNQSSLMNILKNMKKNKKYSRGENNIPFRTRNRKRFFK